MCGQHVSTKKDTQRWHRPPVYFICRILSVPQRTLQNSQKMKYSSESPVLKKKLRPAQAGLNAMRPAWAGLGILRDILSAERQC